MGTIEYNVQSDEVSIAELPSEDDLIERNFKCVSMNRLRSLLYNKKFKGMIIEEKWHMPKSLWYQSFKMIS